MARKKTETPAAPEAVHPPEISSLVAALNLVMRDDFSVQACDSERVVLASGLHGDALEIVNTGDLQQMARAAFKLRLLRVLAL